MRLQMNMVFLSFQIDDIGIPVRIADDQTFLSAVLVDCGQEMVARLHLLCVFAREDVVDKDPTDISTSYQRIRGENELES